VRIYELHRAARRLFRELERAQQLRNDHDARTPHAVPCIARVGLRIRRMRELRKERYVAIAQHVHEPVAEQCACAIWKRRKLQNETQNIFGMSKVL
jgi:hypothetical protein